MTPEIAETAYLFRHAAVRDAAYQLIPLSQRARLHHFALDVLEEGLGASLAAVSEMAEHAREAQFGIFSSELAFREMRYLRLAAIHAASKFENDDACRLWERVASHPAATPAESAEALAEAGVTHWMLGRREPALRCLTDAIGKADPRRLAFCLVERGTLYRDIRDYAQAARDLERALEVARNTGDKPMQLRALGNLCTTQDTHMTQTGVRELYAPVLKLAREIGDTRAIGISEGQIGQACIRGGDFAGAERHLTESIHLLRQAGDKLNEAEMLSSLGRLFRDRADGDRRANLLRAVQLYRDALAVKDQLGFLFQRSDPLTGLAAAHRALGMPAEAKAYALQALQLAQEVGDPTEITAATMELDALKGA